MPALFNIPSTVIVGAGASRELAPELSRRGLARVLLVTDAYMVSSGLVARVVGDLAAAGITVQVFADVQPDPSEENVHAGVALLQSSGAQAVVALGGGSPIDCAKVIAVLPTNPGPISRFMGRHRVQKAGLPLFAVPTTAGTGSEVTKVAVITDTKRDVKMMMLDGHLMPTVALVDFELTLTMPAPLTAAVGIDTLTHGIEAYVSRLATPLTDPLALSCIRLCGEHLETAWREPGNRAAREGMMLAATHGGMAFSNSSVALVHGMSRPIGALFHVPHGISNAMLLPAVTRFSIPGAVPRYATVARTLGWIGAGESDWAAATVLADGLEALNRRLCVPRLGSYLASNEMRFREVTPKMALDALASGSPGNNPVVPSADQIAELYLQAW
ncbi:MAG: iron-containing alcohol dehydrogenase [Verrucomicrobia bacterium]|nr:iron-containing alcohol dehydrogenase [Verrucomicrobiota bacterium]